MFSIRRNVTVFVTIACVALAVCVVGPAEASPTPPATDVDTQASPTAPQATISRDLEDGVNAVPTATTELAVDIAADLAADLAAELAASKDTSLADVAEKGPHGPKPMKVKKKKPMGKHKKKKQSFKDKLMPLLLIPFVIQTMLIPMFIMNLKFIAMKAMTVGKIAILLIVFNMMRNWSQNAHSTSIGGSTGNSMLMAQNYGYNGGPEFGAIFNG